MTSDRRVLGVALALLSAASFGVMPVLTKIIYEDGAEPVGVLAVRFAVAAAVLHVLARGRREVRPGGRTLLLLAGLGSVGYVGQSLSYFFALERISASLTALLLYFFPALVVIITSVLQRRFPRPLVVTCLAVATLGTALTVGPVGGGQTTGVVLGLAAALIYALYIVASSRVVGVGPFTTAAWVLTAGAVTMAVLALVTRPQLPSSTTAWLAMAGVALVGTVVAVAAFFMALSLLGPADTAVLSTVEPVVSIAVAGLVLGERLSALQLAGGAVVLIAVGVLARARPVPRAGAGVTGDDETPTPETPATPTPASARDLVRRRSRSYARDETGRHHHIGAAPDLQPLLDDDGSSYVRTSDVQLASRTHAQLTAQMQQVERQMAAAAADLRFEQAAALRDDLTRITAELDRRT